MEKLEKSKGGENWRGESILLVGISLTEFQIMFTSDELQINTLLYLLTRNILLSLSMHLFFFCFVHPLYPDLLFFQMTTSYELQIDSPFYLLKRIFFTFLRTSLFYLLIRKFLLSFSIHIFLLMDQTNPPMNSLIYKTTGPKQQLETLRHEKTDSSKTF